MAICTCSSDQSDGRSFSRERLCENPVEHALGQVIASLRWSQIFFARRSKIRWFGSAWARSHGKVSWVIDALESISAFERGMLISVYYM